MECPKQLGQAQLSLNLFELKPIFVKGMKRLEAHFIKIVKSLSLDLSSSFFQSFPFCLLNYVIFNILSIIKNFNF